MMEMNAEAWEQYENHYKAGEQDGYERGYKDGYDKGNSDGRFFARLDTIDECIAKIKEEWSYYDETCYEICNELEQLKRIKQ